LKTYDKAFEFSPPCKHYVILQTLRMYLVAKGDNKKVLNKIENIFSRDIDDVQMPYFSLSSTEMKNSLEAAFVLDRIDTFILTDNWLPDKFVGTVLVRMRDVEVRGIDIFIALRLYVFSIPLHW
jgi:hypothetical protein